MRLWSLCRNMPPPRYAKMANLLLEIGHQYYDQNCFNTGGFTNSELIYHYYANQPDPVPTGLKVLLFNNQHALLDVVETSIEALE